MDRTAIDTLQELAQRDTERAARQLQQANQQHRQAQERLSMLIGLRADYEQRRQQQVQTGLSMAALANIHRFIHKIDHAIAGQQQLTQTAAARAEKSSAGWQAKKQAAMIWESLRMRSDRAARQKALARERRQMDEFAARCLRRAGGRDGSAGEDSE